MWASWCVVSLLESAWWQQDWQEGEVGKRGKYVILDYPFLTLGDGAQALHMLLYP